MLILLQRVVTSKTLRTYSLHPRPGIRMASNEVRPVEDTSFQALVQSFAMIIVSEVGDKTFLIAAILAMRHPRMVVFAGAFGSLVVMSILSAELGHLLPTLIPRKWTQAAAAVLFLVFGWKMLQEGREMTAGNEKIQEEMKEAQEEIEGDEGGSEAIPLEALEEGEGGSARPGHVRRDSQPQGRSAGFTEGARNFASLLLGPVFVQSFVLTFLGEWGDRSQISTIALGAAHVSTLQVVSSEWQTHFRHIERLRSRVGNYHRSWVLHSSRCNRGPIRVHKNIRKTWCVAFGSSWLSFPLIHSFAVTLAGSALFLLFGIIYLYEAFLSIDIDVTDFSYNP